jgi:hypothetical protein
MTKDQLKAKILPRLFIKNREDIGTDWVKAIQIIQAGATAQQKAQFAHYLSIADGPNIGRVALEMAAIQLTALAEAEADAMLADDAMSLDEIERAFR